MRKLYIAIILLFATNAFGAPSVCITGEYTIPDPSPVGSTLVGDDTEHTGSHFNARHNRAWALDGSNPRYYTATAAGTAKYAYIRFYEDGNSPWMICAWDGDASGALLECTNIVGSYYDGLNQATFTTGFDVEIGDHIYITPIFADYIEIECGSGSDTIQYDDMDFYDLEPTWDYQGSAATTCGSYTIYLESE